jgi:hypothetical protein
VICVRRGSALEFSALARRDVTASSRLYRRCAAVVAVTLLASCLPAIAMAAPVLTAAEAVIRFTSSTQCEVTLTLAVSGAAEVEHRLELLEGAHVELTSVAGAAAASSPRTIGRTSALVLAPAKPGATYTIAYRVTQAPARPYRCPVWLPTAPADGRSRNVQLHVHVPAGARPGGTMPGFVWTGERGQATLGHLPAFVRVPFTAAGAQPSWDVSRVMDVVTLLVLAGASGLWLRRARGAGARSGAANAAPVVK